MPRHHAVPQFYLRGFANEADQIVLVDRDDTSRSFLVAVRRALAEDGFYRLDPDVFDVEDEAQRPDPEVIEDHLSHFERVAAPGIDKLRKSALANINRDDWYHLINFIALQTVRGNRFREDMEATGTQALRVHLGETITDRTIRGWLEDEGKPASAAEIGDFRERLHGPGGPRLVPAKELVIQESLKLALGQVGERLADGMAWSVIDADQAVVLTSDEPVCWWAPGDDPIGFGSARVVWLPISPRRILQLTDRSGAPESLELPDTTSAAGRDGLVRFVNLQVATQAHRWIVHHPDDQPLANLVLGPRTAWADELVSVEEDGDIQRGLYVHRRLPVLPDDQD